MAIRCRDILSLPVLKKIKVVAGFYSLDRVIRWVHVVEIPHVTHWLHGGELLFMTGIGIKSDVQALLDLVKAIEAKNLAGLVINLGPYIKEVPQDVIDLANSLNFPVFELPWEVRIVEVTQAICSAIVMEQMEEKSSRHLLEDILFSDYDSSESLYDRAVFHGFDLNRPCQVVIVDIDAFGNYLKFKGIKDERQIMEIKNYFLHIVTATLADSGKKALSMLRSDSVVLILPTDPLKEKNLVKDIMDEILENITKKLPGLTASIGIGSCYQDLKELKKSLKEAELALRVIKVSGEDKHMCSYYDLGISRLLFKIQDQKLLDSFYFEMLGDILEYDKSYNSQLVETLDTYLMENKNLEKTAEKLHIHRNTLKYRLKRIREISRRNPDKTYDSLNLQVALVIGKFIRLSE